MKVLSDEVVAVRLGNQDQRVMAFGTPFFGDWGRPGEQVAAPVHGLYFPVKDREDRLVSLSSEETLTRLIPCIFSYTTYPSRQEQLLDLAIRMVSRVPGYDLHFRPGPQFWQVLDAS